MLRGKTYLFSFYAKYYFLTRDYLWVIFLSILFTFQFLFFFQFIFVEKLFWVIHYFYFYFYFYSGLSLNILPFFHPFIHLSFIPYYLLFSFIFLNFPLSYLLFIEMHELRELVRSLGRRPSVNGTEMRKTPPQRETFRAAPMGYVQGIFDTQYLLCRIVLWAQLFFIEYVSLCLDQSMNHRFSYKMQFLCVHSAIVSHVQCGSILPVSSWN